MKKTAYCCTLTLLLLISKSAAALPIGYGYNQGDLEFSEIKDDHFKVYFDSRTPNDAATAIHSLNAAKPLLEKWFKVKRYTPLIVNMSAKSDNASFANFITDSIELQTLGNGSRDLAWHEYTHAMMYQHLKNFFGPAGSLLHLPWMEAWFLEGLAEALSVSVGSDNQASVERYQALTGDWPTWDRIHSLYTSGPFASRGYATSGAFVSWLLRTYGADKMVDSLIQFQKDTMPWWWPWAFTPFNDFWPMDTMLKNWTGFKGKELYEAYKKAAVSHWQTASINPLLTNPKKKQIRLDSSFSFNIFKNQILGLATSGKDYKLRSLVANGTQTFKWSGKSETLSSIEDLWSHAFAKDDSTKVYFSEYWPEANLKLPQIVMITTKQKKKFLKLKSPNVGQIWLSEKDVWWTEYDLEISRLCHVSRESFLNSMISCPIVSKHPTQVFSLGADQNILSGQTENIWLLMSTQTMKGDLHFISVINTRSSTVTKFPWTGGGTPKSYATSILGKWLLISDRSKLYLRRFSSEGTCLESLSVSDVPYRILPSSENWPYLINWVGEEFVLGSVKDLKTDSCKELDHHTSPLLVGVRSSSPIDFQTAVDKASPWSIADKKPDKNAETTASDTKNLLDTATSVNAEDEASLPNPTPSKWRGRPLFLFPWLGADDALGPQLGIVSVPLMDHMQNETVRVTAMMGLYSRYPYQEVSLIENRWSPTWNLGVYRSQTYNGRYRDKETDEIFSSYLDEKGAKLDGDIEFNWRYTTLNLAWGVRGGHLAKYIGDANHYGQFNEVYSGASWTWRFARKWQLLTSLQGKAALKILNETFDYDALGISTGLSRSINKGSVTLGAEASRTRGVYRRDLQEMYTPLKTFVPGSGGGYNKNSYPITADTGLFSPVFGDTQARAKLNATHPLISNLDKFTSLVYIDRLDISGFFNYGTAWRGDKIPDKKRLIGAQGYNLDLLMDNKGVRFNLGSGMGQVLGSPWQVYATAGFDALF